MKSSHVCYIADDNTVYACDKDVESVAMRLEDDISRALDWFRDNRMVANPKQFQVMFLGLKQHQEFFLEIENKSINVTRSVKLLGISVDDELKFDKHVKTLCQKVSRKVSAFSRVTPYTGAKLAEKGRSCSAPQAQGRGVRGRSPRKNFSDHTLFSPGNAPFYIKRGNTHPSVQVKYVAAHRGKPFMF